MTNQEIVNSKLGEGIEDESDNKTNKEIQSGNVNENENYNELDSNTNNIQRTEENKSENPYLKYITQIEQLQNELELEKNITNSLKNYGTSGEELIKLKTDLQENERKLLQLKQTNKKQEEALNNLRKKIAKETPKIKTNSQNKYKNDNKRGDLKQNEAINIVLKIKDRELNDAIQRMNNLKKENQKLKNELYKNEDYNKKLEIKDTSREYSDKIKELNTELKIINKQLAQHKICLNEQNKINNEYKELKNQLKQLKSNTNENKIKINEIQAKPYSISKDLMEKNLFSNRLSNKRKRSVLSVSENKINNFSTIQATSNKNIILPPIATPRKNSENKNNIPNEQSILTKDFIEKIKNYFGNEIENFETLLFKLNEIENCKKAIENKHRNELHQFNKQINALDEQFQILNNNGKANNSNIKVLKNKLNVIKGQTRIQTKKFIELKKEYDSLDDISKGKDYEISLLLGQINSLRNLVSYTNDEMPEDKMDTYINQLKREQKKEIKIEEKNENKGEDDGEKDKKYEKESNSVCNTESSKNIKNEKKENEKKAGNTIDIKSYSSKKNNNKINLINNNSHILNKLKNIRNKNKRYGFSDDKTENGKK